MKFLGCFVIICIYNYTDNWLYRLIKNQPENDTIDFTCMKKVSTRISKNHRILCIRMFFKINYFEIKRIFGI